jgi:hypothetical protein
MSDVFTQEDTRQINDIERVDGDGADEGTVAVGGEMPNAVDDVGAGEPVAAQAVDAEIDGDEADFLT